MLDQKSGFAVVVFVDAAGVSPEKYAMGILKTIKCYEATTQGTFPQTKLSDYTGWL
jgi:hypothetical protein